MNIDSYIKSTKNRLNAFGENWKTQSKDDPDIWPDDLPEEEWDEHFMMYNDMVNEDWDFVDKNLDALFAGLNSEGC